jgi:DNA-directed RNA polymerase subunit N (RpoN/RPB10)
MLYPVCPTCGFLLADKQTIYEESLEKILSDNKLSNQEKIEKRKELFNKIGLIRYCCKMKMLSYIQIEKLLTQDENLLN